MSTFQTRVEDYIGSVADTTMITDHLTAGAKFIIDILPESKLDRFATSLTDSGSGVSILAHRPTMAHKSGYGARLIPSWFAARVVDSGSMYLATNTSPIWYIQNGLAYVKPSGGSVIAISYPTVLYSESAVTGSVIAEYEHGIVLYAALHGALSKYNDKISTLTSLTFDVVSEVIPPSDASYVYNDAILGVYVSTNIGSFGTAPTYNKPTIVLPTTPTDFSFSADVVKPTIPSPLSLVWNVPSLGDFTSVTIDAIPTPPIYIKPTTIASFTSATTYIGTDEDAAKANAELQKQGTILDLYGKDLYNELNEFNGEMENQKLAVQKIFEQAKLLQENILAKSAKQTDLNITNAVESVKTNLEAYQANLQRYTSELNAYQQIVNKEVTLYVTNLDKWKTDRATLLQQYSVDVQNEVNEFNKENTEYQANIQKAIEQAKLDQERLMLTANKTTDLSIVNRAKQLEADIAEYQSILGKYSNQLNDYQLKVNKSIQEYLGKVQKQALEFQTLDKIIVNLKQEFNDYIGRIIR